MDKKVVITENNRKTNSISNAKSTENNAKKDAQIQPKDLARENEINRLVQIELKRREQRRKIIMFICFLFALGCLLYLCAYMFFQQRTNIRNNILNQLKEQTSETLGAGPIEVIIDDNPQFTLDDTEKKIPDVLDEYKTLYSKNKKLIGWIKIVDNSNEKVFLDLPVMQTNDNEYYLTHNMYQEYDNNGTIFMDKDCDVLKPSDNFILYGHQMKNGMMFGNLHKYEKEDFYNDHKFIQFDTIYEKGTYEVMYVFRSHIFNEDEIVFKYYEFIDANGAVEFNSYMREMSELSYYDTGVEAQYGDTLLTLSTCDSQEENGRFVVVAKKIG